MSRRRESRKIVAPVMDQRTGQTTSFLLKNLFESRPVLFKVIPPALAILVFLNTLWNGFAHDDNQQILENKFITDIGNLPLAFTSGVWSFIGDSIRSLMDAYFRPVFTSYLMMGYAIFGTSAWGWHLMSLLVHAAVTLLVFLVLREMTGRVWVAFGAACLFAVHPVHVESVAWISGVTDPLMSLFFLVALLFFLRFEKSGRKYLIALSGVFFLLSALTKETGLMLPMIILCWDAVFGPGTSIRGKVSRAAALAGVFAVPTMAYFAMRFFGLGSALTGQGHELYPLGPALMTIPGVLIKYFSLMLIPINYNFQHRTPFVEAAASLAFIVPLAILLAAAAGIVLARSRELTFAALWILITLLPALAAVRILHPVTMVQERYLYLPSLGLCFAIALGFERLAAREKISAGFRGVILAIPVVAIAALGAISFNQSRTWLDTTTLFRRCVEVNPQSPYAHNALATSYWLKGMPRDAEAEARRALDISPTCTDSYINLSYMAQASGNRDQAIDLLQQALSTLLPNVEARFYNGRLHHDLGLLYEDQKNFDQAEANLKAALEALPTLPHRFDLGEFYFDRGRYEEALEMFEQTEQRVPAWFAPIHLRLGRTCDRLGQKDRARAEYQKYLDVSRGAKDYNEVRRRLTQL